MCSAACTYQEMWEGREAGQYLSGDVGKEGVQSGDEGREGGGAVPNTFHEMWKGRDARQNLSGDVK